MTNRLVTQIVNQWVVRSLMFHYHPLIKNLHYFSKYCKEVCISTKCGEFVVPDEHLKPCKTCDANGRRCRQNSSKKPSKGVTNADFVLYVSAVPTAQCSETIGKWNQDQKMALEAFYSINVHRTCRSIYYYIRRYQCQVSTAMETILLEILCFAIALLVIY